MSQHTPHYHGRNTDNGSYDFSKKIPKSLSWSQKVRIWYTDFYKQLRFGISNNNVPYSRSLFSRIKKPIVYTVLILFGLYFVWLYGFVYSQLPTLTPEGLSQMKFSKTSVVSDRNDKPLYKFYEENREYVSYDKISEQAVNAFVAMEDQSFWTNEGIDIKGVLRAMFSTVRSTLGLGGRAGGASTITQQLLKNVLKLNENEFGIYDKIVRKHKEWLLVGKLGSVIQSDVEKKYPSLSSQEVERKKKERVMELYLNYIYLGNQAYGIEAASQSYFGKSAKDISIVEGAILASMPQAPTKYNPYKYPTKVLGSLHIRDAQGQDILSGSVFDGIVGQISTALMADEKKLIPGNNVFQDYIIGIVPKTITINNAIYQVSYEAGRKDAVLNRMYEDAYITQDQLKRAFIDGLMLKLQEPRIDIKAPHFVFYIRDLLTRDDPRFKDLGITEEMLYEGGIQIKTSLDLDVQDIAEKSIKDNMPILFDRGGTNRSLVHVDTTNGDILAYVGSADYNNVEIQGQNDMVRNPRQPGSSIKPLIYSYALQKLPITLDTPIYDIPLSIGSFTPSNADARFEGLLPLREALAHSRNIPAIKAYFAAGKEPELKPFLQGLGLKSLRNSTSYGYSLALGAGEVPMLEMAQAYSYLSQKGEGYEINPILEIRGADGQILYQKEPKKVVSSLKAGPAYLIRKILSDSVNMPASWVGFYSIKGLKYGVKSGTSNKVITVGGKEKSLPRDGWLATYTPSRVTMYWGGNADDKPMNANALGLLLNSEVNKSFYGQMLSKGYIKNEEMAPVDVASVSISKVTGKIATDATPSEYIVKTWAFNANIGTDTNYTSVSIDMSCGGKASPLTPSEQRIRAYIFTPVSITTLDTDAIAKWYADGLKTMSSSGYLVNKNTNYNFPYLMTKQPENYCDGREIQLTDDIAITTPLTPGQAVPLKFDLSFGIESHQSHIKKVSISLGDTILGSFSYNDFLINDTKAIRIRKGTTGQQTLQITAIAENKKAQVFSLPVTITNQDVVVPVVTPPLVESGSTEIPTSGEAPIL